MVSEYTFRIADKEDEQAIIDFVNEHWPEKHPLVNVPEYFEYYYEGRDDTLNFVLCEKEEQIAAVAGFVYANQADDPDVWLSIWLADDNHPGTGLEVLKKVPELTECRTFSCNNLRPGTLKLHDSIGYSTGRVGHFYRLADKSNYELAQISEKKIYPVVGKGKLVRYKEFNELRNSGFTVPQKANPRKDLWYLRRRYYSYPRLSYDVHGVVMPGQRIPNALLVSRLIEVENTDIKVLRIVDFIGEQKWLVESGVAIENYMKENDVEYADFYNVGIGSNMMRAAGFTERYEDDENIIPNYLEPPILENTEYYFSTNNPARFRLCKADGDQDRPHIKLD